MPSLLDIHESVHWAAIESSVLKAAAYDPAEQLLYLEFHSGDIYRYFDFLPEQYRDLLAAESKGKYFNRYIRYSFAYEPLPQSRRASR